MESKIPNNTDEAVRVIFKPDPNWIPPTAAEMEEAMDAEYLEDEDQESYRPRGGEMYD